MALSNTDKKILTELKSRQVEKDSCVCVMLELKEPTKQNAFIEWLIKNPKAGEVEILDYLF